MGKLYYGDNLVILNRYIKDESVDLTYLDPPFNSKQSYNAFYKEKDGTAAASQIQAFKDTWHWNVESEAVYLEITEQPGKVGEVMQAFMTFLGRNDMMAYLTIMAPRLVELHRVLKPTGSLYLHCDPTASHYLKLLCDAVYGAGNFVNEICWRRYGVHNDVGQGSIHYGRVHDVILYYGKTAERTWNQVFTPLNPVYIEKNYRLIEAETGRRFTTTPITGPGGAEKGNPVFEWKGHTRAWRYSKETMVRLDKEGKLHYSRTGYVRQKRYLDESKGVPVQEWWDDIKALTGAHAERLGYPTQKTDCPAGTYHPSQQQSRGRRARPLLWLRHHH